MLNPAIEKALNDQINFEIHSSYIYLSMAAWFESQDLPGFANWMRVQVKEELFHAEKFFNYILERDGKVTLTSIDGPATEWTTPFDAFNDAYGHEQKVTARIHAIAALADQEKDYATVSFIKWFIDEQVEEEANTKKIAQQLKWIGSDGAAIFMLDEKLAARVFTLPAGGAP